jgi:hypothetical protein
LLYISRCITGRGACIKGDLGVRLIRIFTSPSDLICYTIISQSNQFPLISQQNKHPQSWHQSTTKAITSATSPSEVSYNASLCCALRESIYLRGLWLTSPGRNSNTSESTGRVTDVLTQPGQQADRNVQASPDEPRYEVLRPFLPMSSPSVPFYSQRLLSVNC